MKVGIVGTGAIAQYLCPYFSSWGVETAAVCGSPGSEGQVDALADRLGAVGRYTDYRQMVRDASLDTVYVAVPNGLHYAVTMAALEAGKHVVCEKPLAASEREAAEMAALARERGLFLWEAVVTTRQPNFKLIRDELLGRIGTIKLAAINYTQYSHRYDEFRAGELPPAFDAAKAGGAIMDLGLYTLTFTLGLFGEPQRASYRPNVERGIDTSGIIDLDYEGLRVVNVCAKDCGAPNSSLIQGTEGYILMESSPNVCGPVTLRLNDGSEERYDRSLPVMWEGEFREFCHQMEAGDLAECYRQLDESLLVSRVQNGIRREAGVIFPADAQR